MSALDTANAPSTANAPTSTSYYRSGAGARDVADRYRDLLNDWPVDHTEHRLATRQGETFVVECGSAGRPPLLLIHGALANSTTWMSDVPLWAPHFHLFAVDVIGEPGFSASSRPALDSDAYASWLDEVLTGLGLTAVSVAGISLGGWLGLDLAIRRPERVTNLIVIAPAGVGPQRNVLLWVVPLSLLGKWGRKRVLERMLGPAPEQVSDTVRRFGAMHERISREFRPRHERLPIFSDSQLAGLTMPVMAVVAGRDVMLAPGPMRQRLEANVPDLEMHYLPEARHFPGSQAERVLHFLTRRS